MTPADRGPVQDPHLAEGAPPDQDLRDADQAQAALAEPALAEPALAEPAQPKPGLSGDEGARAQLLEPDELQGIIGRWREIQAEFVDEPRTAVRDADELVADLMQRMTRMLAAEREQLESQWASGGDVSTEDLRQGLRRYRSFFERLLAA